MKNTIQLMVASTVLLLSGSASHAFAQSNWGVTKTFHIGGDGGWDYLTVDRSTHRLFVPRSTHTMVIDADSGKVLGDIPGQKTAHGVAIAPKVGRGFITDGGGSGAIVVFDLKTYAVLGTIPTMPDSDGIIYDGALDRVLAVSGDGGVLMTFKPDIDPKNGKIDPPIMLGGAPEFLASDGAGKVYINLEDKDTVAVVDLNSRKVTARWPVAPGGHPVGMSMDTKSRRLFIGCRNPQKLIVMSADDGKVEASLPIGAGVDATKVMAEKSFASCRDGSLVVAAEKAGKFEVEQVVKTPEGARTMGVDETSQLIYLPTAELEPATTGRPKPKPGTFMIVVVGQR
ncbi:YncE family protein [Alloacidobacterium dinghuense]|uniref:YncE family protein n=1 Tax=Alloacidobacterium dinghuense TaxID=2763107 RepID=A0A7G8BF49_9BACT|nr:YncE family protein [Alloacidobacterium dinghuense]QNI31169.1 YncE family protein [Alloacidobacterium dinghuense]